MARPRKSDYNAKDAMLGEFREAARQAKQLRELIQTQIGEIVAGISPQMAPKERLAIVEQLSDVYAKQIRAMEVAWKSLASKDGSPGERDPTLAELLEIAKR